MKSITKYLGIAALLLTTACSQTQEGVYYTPNSDDAQQIHFIQSTIEKEFPKEASVGTIEVEIARPGNQGTYTLKLLNKGTDAGLFRVPESVSIPDGQYAVKVPVEVDLSNCITGSNYKTAIYILSSDATPGDNGAQVSQYKDRVNLSATFELEWEPLYRTSSKQEKVPQLATFNYKLYYTGRDVGLEVDKAVDADIYRLHDWGSGVYFKFIVHPDKTCTVPAQSIGFLNTNYNEYVYVADMAVYLGDEAAYSTYPCTFDGKNTYTFNLIYYVSSGYFAKGVETLVFDADPDTTPVVEIDFEGIENTPTGFDAPRLAFWPNTYTKFYKAAVVSGDITADENARATVRQQLVDDQLDAVTPVLTLYEADASVWNVPTGNFTAVALAYDSIDKPCELYIKRFTCDPKDEFTVKVHAFEFALPEANPNYSPYNSLIWNMRTSNVKSMKYLCMRPDIGEYLCEFYKMTLEELTAARGVEVSAEILEQLNSEQGRSTAFNTLDEGCSYTLSLVMTNEFGDRTFVSQTATTDGHFAEDFDQTKTLADFTGAFLATSTVETGSSSAQTSYRIDISRVNDHNVLIEGMSDMRDFAPRLAGYYDKDKHMLIVEPQYAGPYGSKFATLGFSDGFSIYWGGVSIAFGYIGERIYCTPNPYSSKRANGYGFLLFSTPEALGSSYLAEYVGSKMYRSITLFPLQLDPSKPAARNTTEQLTQRFRVGGRWVKNHLASPQALKPSGRMLRSAAVVPTATIGGKPSHTGKTMRTDLTLHTR